MKQYLITAVLLTVIVQSQCGFFGDLIDSVKDTSHVIKKDISGAVHYGKHIVFGGQQPTIGHQAVSENKGIIGRITYKIHDVSQNLRRTLQDIFVDEDGNTIIGRMFDRMKARIVKLKGLFFGQMIIEGNTTRFDDDTKTMRDKLQMYFFKNGTSQHAGIKKTLDNLKTMLENIRNNVTRHNKNKDGTGLIDIRMAPAGSVLKGINENARQIENSVTSYNTKHFNEDEDTASTQRNRVHDSVNGLDTNFRNDAKKVEDSLNKVLDNSREDEDRAIWS